MPSPSFFDFLRDPDSMRNVRQGVTDALNRGMVAGALGAPVDLATQAANLGVAGVGYAGHKLGLLSTPPELIDSRNVPGSSEWIGQKMQNANAVSANRNVPAEFAASLLSMGAPKAAQKVGGLLYQAEKNMAMPSTIANQRQRGMLVYHGSPHKFSAFDSSKMGSGEGAQVYGKGLYLAENPRVADEYAGKLSRKSVQIDGYEPSAAAQEVIKALEARVNATQYGSGRSSAWDDLQNIIRHGNDVMKTGAREIEKNAGFLGGKMQIVDDGHLYKVDLPDQQIAKMIDWDSPILAQPKHIQDAARSLLGAEFDPRITGNELFGRLPNAESQLAKHGVPGVRYLDAGSREAGGGTSNFVVFPSNEGLLRILERNGQPIK